MIKVSKDDNIFDVLLKIQNEENPSKKKLILEVPFWHPILHNYVSLKSIINKIWDKKLIIVTTDLNSKKIWKKLGIKYSIIKNSDFIENKQENILKYNYSFFEYLKYEINKYLNLFKSKVFKNQKITNLQKKYLKYQKQKSNIFIFVLLLWIVSFIFLYIFFFALNKTIIYITPEIEVQTKSKNFIFNSKINPYYKKKNEQEIKEYKDHIELTYNYKTTWIEQKDKYKAKTTVNFINKFDSEIKLLPHTRLLSSSWILFETQNWVKIPAAIKNNAWELIPGIKQADIVAKTFDNKWLFIWKRANNSSSWITLKLPWLKENQDMLFAKTTKEITWWQDIYTHIVSKDDIDNSIKILKEKLRKKAIEELNKKIQQDNKANNVTFKILNIDNTFKFKNIKTKILENVKSWDKKTSYNLSWSLDTATYTYNIDSVISKLKKEIQDSIIPEKQRILSINNQSIRISNIIYRQDNPFYLKATIEIEYFIEYNFEKQDDSYIQRLKNTIAWLDKQQAEKILINENKISNARIEIKPFFLNKVSKFFNNIKFVIEN